MRHGDGQSLGFVRNSNHDSRGEQHATLEGALAGRAPPVTPRGRSPSKLG